jgi:short-subunit dehydrogenase
MTLQGKHYWLIGASEGIGRALAILLAKQGVRLTLSARNEARLTTLRTELNGDGHRILPCDVTDSRAFAQAWQNLRDNGQSLDGVIYNAGAYEPMAADALDVTAMATILAVNYSGMVNVLGHIIPAFVAQKKGHIVLVGSIAGYRGLPNAMGYGASKAAVNHLAENLRCDLACYGIHVQLVCPGFVRTRLTDKNTFTMPGILTPEKAAEHIVNGMKSPRFEIAFPALFAFAFKLLKILPAPLYFFLVGRR